MFKFMEITMFKFMEIFMFKFMEIFFHETSLKLTPEFVTRDP